MIGQKKTRGKNKAKKPKSTTESDFLSAVEKNDVEKVKEFLDKSPRPEKYELEKALHVATVKGFVQCVEALLDHAVDPDCENASGSTPLMLAAHKGHTQVVEELLRAWCSINNQVWPQKATALHYAASAGHLDIVTSLIKAGFPKNQPTLKGKTPLILAAKSGHEAVVKKLLELGASANKEDFESHACAIHFATENNHPLCVQALIDGGADPNAINGSEMTPLLLAASHDHMTIMRLLLSNPRVDKEAFSHCGQTALHWAVRNENAKAIRLLLKHGLACDAKMWGGYMGPDAILNKNTTPLLLACSLGYLEGMDLLIEAGANVNAMDGLCFTPLSTVCRDNRADCMLKLIQHGADYNGSLSMETIEEIDPSFDPFYGGRSKHFDRVDFFSPLYQAIKFEATDCVRLLLKYTNSDLYLGSFSKYETERLLDVAISSHYEEGIDMLLIAGCPDIRKSLFYESTMILSSDKKMQRKVDDAFDNPRSLKHMARKAVRERLDRNIYHGVNKLGLPTELCKYLTFPELDQFTKKRR